jgi:lipocalin
MVYPKLKCLGSFSIHDKSTVKFVGSPFQKSASKTTRLDNDRPIRIVGIPSITYLVYR